MVLKGRTQSPEDDGMGGGGGGIGLPYPLQRATGAADPSGPGA